MNPDRLQYVLEHFSNDQTWDQIWTLGPCIHHQHIWNNTRKWWGRPWKILFTYVRIWNSANCGRCVDLAFYFMFRYFQNFEFMKFWNLTFWNLNWWSLKVASSNFKSGVVLWKFGIHKLWKLELESWIWISYLSKTWNGFFVRIFM